MGAVDLTSDDFWQSEEPVVLVNDRDPRAVEQADVISEKLCLYPELRGHLLFATSGSTGEGKWVALSRQALLVSARAVNKHLDVTGQDSWLSALPTYHVGGMGIMARAYDAGVRVACLSSGWDAQVFEQALADSAATLTSLVPAQVSDLIKLELRAPIGLRAVLVGGGALAGSVYERAIDLGWPVIETYGMTETSSQVATASLHDRAMKILPCWQARVAQGGILMLRGEPLLSGYVCVRGDDLVMDMTSRGSWFSSRDRVHIDGDSIQFLGRADRSVKVLGELVDLAQIEKSLENIHVVAVSDERAGNRIIGCAENNQESVRETINHYNKGCSPVERVSEVMFFSSIPKSPLGKVKYGQLREMCINRA